MWVSTVRVSMKRVPVAELPMEDAPEPAAAAGQYRAVAAGESAEAVRRAVLALPHRYREAVILFYFHEMDVSEAARTMGLPEGTVKARLSRARALLRRRFPHLEAEHAAMGMESVQAGKEA